MTVVLGRHRIQRAADLRRIAQQAHRVDVPRQSEPSVLGRFPQTGCLEAQLDQAGTDDVGALVGTWSAGSPSASRAASPPS